MNRRLTITLSGICLFVGMLYFAIAHEVIIFNFAPKSAPAVQQAGVNKRKMSLFCWYQGTWHTEHNELLWPADTANALHYLINSWLTMLDEEEIMSKKVAVQSVILTNTGKHALVSLDRTPFDNGQSTYTKWRWLEGLLKTVRESGISLSHLRLLVHHQELLDDHLDFSRPWPLHGFA